MNKASIQGVVFIPARIMTASLRTNSEKHNQVVLSTLIDQKTKTHHEEVFVKKDIEAILYRP